MRRARPLVWDGPGVLLGRERIGEAGCVRYPASWVSPRRIGALTSCRKPATSR